ncbi:hypothetical protein PFISCL1PPCAC_9022, partial [Pristionchus fissidentatus]
QNVSVKGTLYCKTGNIRQGNVRVELWERDIAAPVDPDDHLADVYSNHLGEFRLSGATSEVLNSKQ